MLSLWNFLRKSSENWRVECELHSEIPFSSANFRAKSHFQTSPFKMSPSSQVPKRVVSKRVVLADVPLYRHFIFLIVWFFYVLAVWAGTTVPYVYPQEVRRYHRGTTVPPLYPQEVRRYHPCTLRRYDGTTPVLSGGTTVPPLYLELVRL